MDKMRMEIPDLTAENIGKIAALFPNCITEAMGTDGKLKRAVNFDLLRQMLSGDVVEGDKTYELTWAGKKTAINRVYATGQKKQYNRGTGAI